MITYNLLIITIYLIITGHNLAIVTQDSYNVNGLTENSFMYLGEKCLQHKNILSK